MLPIPSYVSRNLRLNPSVEIEPDYLAIGRPLIYRITRKYLASIVLVMARSPLCEPTSAILQSFCFTVSANYLIVWFVTPSYRVGGKFLPSSGAA